MTFNANFPGEKEVSALHNAAVKTLADIGVRFQHEEALETFRKNGASLSGETVRIPETLLQKALKTVPGKFVLKGRDTSRDITVGGPDPVLAGASGPVFARRGGEKHLATTGDFLDLLKLTETSKVVNICNYIIVEPQDRPEEKRKLFQAACALRYSSKPLIGITMGKGRTQEYFKLLRDFYDDPPGGPARAIGIISPISPLVYDEGMSAHIIDYAKNGQPIMIAACSQPGATSPVTLAGTLVIDTAEVLAGLVLSQLIRPGLPVIMGSTSTACDLRYVAPAIGSPETGLITLAFKALCNYYHVPCRSGGALTDAKLLDMQAGAESAMAMMPAIFCGVDFILHACGVMDSFNTVCLEKFLVDEDIAEAMIRMKRGFDVDGEGLALDSIAEAGTGGNFMMLDHTMEHCRETFLPKIFSREGFSQWQGNGSKDVEAAAGELLEKRLAGFQFPEITKEQEKLLQKYMEE